MGTFLIRYGEIALKSNWVRKQFQDKLVANIQDYFFKREIECMMRPERGRVFLDTDYLEEAREIIGRIFGVTSFSLVESTSSNMDDIASLAVQVFASDLAPGKTFAVRARRSGSHEFTSPELAGFVGRTIQSVMGGLKVDLDNPDVEILIEVRENQTYVFKGRTSGPGGMPLGTQGVVLATVGSNEDIAGAWLMMKRGCKVHIAHPNREDLVEPLKMWDIRLVSHNIGEASLESVIEKTGSQGLVMSWMNKGLKSVRDIPVFYPTIGLSKDELARLLERIRG